jgi:hypothetical protein
VRYELRDSCARDIDGLQPECRVHRGFLGLRFGRWRRWRCLLAAMDDAAMERNLSGPYNSVKEALAALDEE